MADKITCTGYLIITDRRRYSHLRPEPHIVAVRAGKPSLKKNEVAVKIRISLPVDYFEERFPTANIEVPADLIIEPEVTVEGADEP